MAGSRPLVSIAPKLVAGGSVPPQPPVTQAVRRQPIVAACQACRTRKTKCTAERPKCKYCASKNIHCEYTTLNEETQGQALKRKYSELQSHRSAAETIIEWLTKRPRSEALDVLEELRAGTDPETLVKSIRDGDLLLQLRLVPESRYRHVFPVKREMPAWLYRDLDNIYLHAYCYDVARPPELANQTSTPGQESPHAGDERFSRPYYVAEVIEPVLEDAMISNWTSITRNELLLKQLIKQYIWHTHQFWPLFHKDLFFSDLKNGRTRFCSSLLVNVILADACHGHPDLANRNQPWNSRTLGYRFMAEAKRLWELENGRPSLTTIQAGAIMNMALNVDALDKIGLVYLREAVKMAEALQLFRLDADLDHETMIVRSVTAWGLFCWQIVSTFHFESTPMIKDPPEMPLPSPSEESDWYSETSFRYPGSSIVWHANSAQTFYWICKFRVIVNDLAQAMYGTSKKFELRQARSFLQRFEQWFADLPPYLQPQNVVLPAQLQIHLHYYDVIKTMLEPFASQDLEYPWLGNSTLPGQYSIAKKLDQAKLYIETLMRLYYLRHSYESYDSMIAYLLSVYLTLSTTKCKKPGLAADIIKDANSSVALILKGIADQSKSCHWAIAIFIYIRSSMGQEYDDLLAEHSDLLVSMPRREVLLEHVHVTLPINSLGVEADQQKKPLEQLLAAMTLGPNNEVPNV